MNKKSTNPLYVVTNKGKDVEVASGFIDALIKRFHLAPFIEAFEAIFKDLMDLVKSYPLLVSVNLYISQMVQKIEELAAMLGMAGPSKI